MYDHKNSVFCNVFRVIGRKSFLFFVLRFVYFVLADASGVLCFVIMDYAERQRWGHFLVMGNSYGVFCA